MAKKIQMWATYGPKLAITEPITAEELIEWLVQNTSQTRGNILAVLAELDEAIIQGLRNGRIVQLPNGTHYRPIGKKDGSIHINVRVSPRVRKQVNVAPRARWLNGEHVCKSEAKMIAFWNAQHPENPIED